MPARDNVQFTNLQHCNFAQLTAYQSTGDQVVHGIQQEYEKVIDTVAAESTSYGTDVSDRPLFEVVNTLFHVQSAIEGFSTYSDVAVAKLYPALKSIALPALINAHLHEHFLRSRPQLTVIDPIESTSLDLFREQATAIANSIAVCPSSPLPSSCPPAMARCKPCKGASVIRSRSLDKVHPNTYIVATVPHP